MRTLRVLIALSVALSLHVAAQSAHGFTWSLLRDFYHKQPPGQSFTNGRAIAFDGNTLWTNFAPRWNPEIKIYQHDTYGNLLRVVEVYEQRVCDVLCGDNLDWYRCEYGSDFYSDPCLCTYRISGCPESGISVMHRGVGVGALAFGSGGALYGGSYSRGSGLDGETMSGRVWEIDLDTPAIDRWGNDIADTAVATPLFVFDFPTGDNCFGQAPGLIDGLEYRDDTNTLYLSDDGGRTVYEVTLGGDLVSSFDFPGDCNSGIAFDGAGLWMSDIGRDSLIHRDRTGVKDLTRRPAYGAEDISYDDLTFAPKCAVWTNEATLSVPRIRAHQVPCQVHYADVFVSEKKASKQVVSPGEIFTYTIMFGNNGPDTVQVGLADNLRRGLGYVHDDCGGTIIQQPGPRPFALWRATFPALGPGAPRTCRIQVRVEECTSDLLVNRASARAFSVDNVDSVIDPETGNNYNGVAITCKKLEFTVVPIRINLLNHVSIRPEEALEAVEIANQIFEEVGINVLLVPVVEVQTRVTAGDIFGDGIIHELGHTGGLVVEEGYTMREGRKQALELPYGGGITIYFAKGIEQVDGTPNYGLAWSGFRTAIIDDDATLGAMSLWGSEVVLGLGLTIVHELGHVAGHNKEAEKDPSISIPPDQLRLNMMNGKIVGTVAQDSLGSSGEVELAKLRQIIKKINLIDTQRERIQSGLARIGHSVAVRSPGQLVRLQFGAVVDDAGDVIAGLEPYLGLAAVELFSVEENSDLELILATETAFPPAGAVDASYRLLFDADSDPMTGELVEGVPGIESEVRIDVIGDQAVGPLAVSASVVVEADGTETPLQQATHEPLLTTYSDDPVLARLLVGIPRDLLGLSANEVPVTVISQDPSGVADTASFVFDQKAFEKIPILTLTQDSAEPGGLVDFTIDGLTPDETFDLRAREEIVLTDTVASNGTFAGNFIFPALPPGRHFVIAQDATGAFAFNVIAVPVWLSFELEKAEVEWEKNKIKLSGSIELPPSSPYFTVEPVGQVGVSIVNPGGNPMVLVEEAVAFTVKGGAGNKWEYVMESAALGLRKFKANWEKTRFRYNRVIAIKSEHLGADSTTLEIEPGEITAPFAVAIGGVTIGADGVGGVTVQPTGAAELDVDDDGEIEVELPFALTPDMVIGISGAVTETITVGDYFELSMGKVQIEAGFDGSAIDPSALVPTLDVGLSFGTEELSGQVHVGPADWKDVKPNEWKYKLE